jgi:hypothetical protein
VGDQATDIQAPVLLVEDGLAVVLDDEEFVVGGQPGIESFPVQLLGDDPLGRLWDGRRRVVPGDQDLVRVTREAGPAARNTVIPAKAAPPPFNRVRRDTS